MDTSYIVEHLNKLNYANEKNTGIYTEIFKTIFDQNFFIDGKYVQRASNLSLAVDYR